MNNLNKELERLNTFLIKVDGIILKLLNNKQLDTGIIEDMFSVRSKILDRIQTINQVKMNKRTWDNYKFP